jgi:hypothetical protein
VYQEGQDVDMHMAVLNKNEGVLYLFRASPFVWRGYLIVKPKIFTETFRLRPGTQREESHGPCRTNWTVSGKAKRSRNAEDALQVACRLVVRGDEWCITDFQQDYRVCAGWKADGVREMVISPVDADTLDTIASNPSTRT